MSVQVLPSPTPAFTPSLTSWDYIVKPTSVPDYEDNEPLFGDLFCGGGGSLLGGLRAFSRLGLHTPGARILAVNHDQRAIDTCRANHPNVEAIDCDLERLDPRTILRGRTLRALWASAPCQNHSRAAGGKPKNWQKRATPDYILDWIFHGRPRVYFEENVWEITDWNDETGSWSGHCQAIEAMDYTLEYRLLDAADYGAPQNRKRLILVATRDGVAPPTFPKPTHCNPKKPVGGRRPWRGAIEILDLDEDCPSIFGRRTKNGDPNPYAVTTRARLSRHLRREDAFYEPLARAVDGDAGPVPLAELLAATPEGLWPEWVQRVGDELHIYAAEPFIDNRYGTGVCTSVRDPLWSMTASDGKHHALVVPRILGQHGGAISRSTASPLPTEATAGFIRFWTVRCVLPPRGIQGGVDSNPARSVKRPLGSVLAQHGAGHFAGVRIDVGVPVVLPHHGERPGQAPRIHPANQPLPTAPASRRLQVAFLYVYTYNGNANIRPVERPLTTETTVQRHSVVQLRVDLGELMVDIGMRPLTVRELARGQTFPDWYSFVGNIGEQTRQIGNAVPPDLAEAVILANAPALLGAHEVTA